MKRWPPKAAGAIGVKSALMLVQSVIVPQERVVLIDPAHPDCARIKPTAVRRFEYNKLFREA